MHVKKFGYKISVKNFVLNNSVKNMVPTKTAPYAVDRFWTEIWSIIFLISRGHPTSVIRRLRTTGRIIW